MGHCSLGIHGGDKFWTSFSIVLSVFAVRQWHVHVVRERKVLKSEKCFIVTYARKLVVCVISVRYTFLFPLQFISRYLTFCFTYTVTFFLSNVSM